MQGTGEMCQYLTTDGVTLPNGTVTYNGEWLDAIGKMSNYKPARLGPNCAVVENGECVSKMSWTMGSQDWKLWEGCALACPKGFEYSLWMLLPGQETFICLDRGGKIVTTNSITYPGRAAHWLDLLLEVDDVPPVPYGTEIPVRFMFGTFVPLE